MGANYSPNFAPYSQQGAFRYWCQTVLPLVYDDSLSYYELLNKMVVYLNNVISDVSTVETNLDAVKDSYDELERYVNEHIDSVEELVEQLESYVDTYFDNLDVQNEIDHKLDEMATSGALADLISPLVPDAVSAWLRDNITPTTPAVDATLTVSEAAADAKAVGDNFAGSFSAETAYKRGNVVLYNGKLYVFIKDHAAGAFNLGSGTDGGDVLPLTFGYSVMFREDGYNQLATFADVNTGVKWYPFKRGARWCSSSTATIPVFLKCYDGFMSEYSYCELIPCQEGDEFHVKIYGGSAANRGWAWLKSDLSWITRANSSVNVDGILTAPADSAYLAISTRNEQYNASYNDYYVYKGKTVVTRLEEIADSIVELSERVDTDIDNLTAAIGTSNENVTPLSTADYYWNSETSVAVLTEFDGYKAYQPLELVTGYDYYITVRGAHSKKQNPVLVVDENYNIVRRFGSRDSNNNVSFTAEDGEKYALITTTTGHRASVYVMHLNSIGSISDIVYALEGGKLDLNEKTVAIIGDSISCNGNYSSSNLLGNVPEIVVQEADVGISLSAYATYYDIGTTVGGHTISSSDVGNEITFTPVADDVGKIIGKPYNTNSTDNVWWSIAAERLGFTPIPVSWSGSSISSHESTDNTLKTSYAWHDAQIRKCGIRTPGSMTRTAPDVIIIYRGTNDFSHSPYTELTDYLDDGINISIPATDSYIDGGQTKYDFLKALAITVDKLRTAYPEAQIVVCTFNYFHRLSSSYPGFPSRNGKNTIYEYNNAIRAFANYFGCGLIEFDKDGINYANAASGAYYQEGTGTNSNHTHPNEKGQRVLGNRAIIDLQNLNAKS